MASSILSRDRIKYTDYLGPSQQGENCFLNQPVLYKPWQRQKSQKCWTFKIQDISLKYESGPYPAQANLQTKHVGVAEGVKDSYVKITIDPIRYVNK